MSSKQSKAKTTAVAVLETGVQTKKPNYVESLVWLFAQMYQQSRGFEYVSIGKAGKPSGVDTAAVGALLLFMKKKYPNADSAEMTEHFRRLYDGCLRVNDKWLYDNMSLPIIRSKLNQIIAWIKRNPTGEEIKAPNYHGVNPHNLPQWMRTEK